MSPGPERATGRFDFGAVRDRALGQPVLAAVAGRGAVGHAHDLRSMRYVRWRRRRRRRRRGRLRGGRRPGTTMRCVTRGLAASAAAVAPASTERPSMGVYELARAAASRCAARIEEFPVFRLAWSERGAPRVILPVFRLAWSERGAPRRSCAAGGGPGCAWCVYEAAACGLPTRLAGAEGMV